MGVEALKKRESPKRHPKNKLGGPCARLGLPYDDFWRKSLRECDLIVSETVARQNADLQGKRVLQQEMAHLMSFAVNDPKNIPDFTKEKDEAVGEVMSKKEADIRLRSLLVGWAAVSKG